MTEGKCAIWGTSAIVRQELSHTVYDSPRAGGTYKLAIFMDTYIRNKAQNPNNDHFKLKLTSWLISQKLSSNQSPSIERGFDADSFLHERLLSFSKRVDRFFRFCMSKNIRPGAPIYSYLKSPDGQVNVGLDSEEIYAWTEVLDFNEFQFFKYLLIESGYLQSYSLMEGMHPIYDMLSAKGFEKLEEYEASNQNSKQAFVAMLFDPSLNDSYENAIEPAIRDAGYEPRIIRKVEHNNKIDDEIIAEIRRSKFVIADFTCGFSKDGSEAIARGGVYYEAGFAQGLGLPVIWTCHEDIISHVHFDTRQYNHIVWKDAADLKKRLYDRIRATIT